MIYFDYSASTPPYVEVVHTISELMLNYYGNPSSLHRMGVEAEKLLKQARDVIANCMGADAEDIIFTSGGTESNNLAIRGYAHQWSSRGKHLITSQIEHSSVYECFKQLEREGFEVTYVPVDHTGSVSCDNVLHAIREDTILVSIMHVNNETGCIQPIEEIGALLANYPMISFHVDAVQSVGKLLVHPRKYGVDMLSMSAHKFHGPKGVGVLYRRAGIILAPLILGGGQEYGIRAGTENVPLIVGMAKALRIGIEKQAANLDDVMKLRHELVAQLETVEGLILTGLSNERHMLAHIVHFCLPGIRSEIFLHALETKGMCVSAKSACSSGEDLPSRVLLAMGLDERRARSGIRVSLSPDHDSQDVKALVEAVKQIIVQLRKI